jgi:transposase-like protein
MIMRQSDVTCPKCHSGYRRIELVSRKGSKGEFHCVSCDQVLEVFDGSTYVAIRLTVQPRKDVRVSNSVGKGLAGLSRR